MIRFESTTLNLFTLVTFVLAGSVVAVSFGQQREAEAKSNTNETSKTANSDEKGSAAVNTVQLETITLGAGCFWCVEAIFQELDGVVSVTSGYSNGKVANPTYKQVCTGQTGCVEVCQLVYDPSKVSLGKILHVFWRTHDPTTLNRQGNDRGTQYRSGIYYHTERQRQYAALYKKKLNDVNAFGKPVVTEIVPIKDYSVAEDYHQNYFRDNPNGGYCRGVIAPKMEKFRKVFADVLKD